MVSLPTTIHDCVQPSIGWELRYRRASLAEEAKRLRRLIVDRNSLRHLTFRVDLERHVEVKRRSPLGQRRPRTDTRETAHLHQSMWRIQ